MNTNSVCIGDIEIEIHQDKETIVLISNYKYKIINSVMLNEETADELIMYLQKAITLVKDFKGGIDE